MMRTINFFLACMAISAAVICGCSSNQSDSDFHVIDFEKSTFESQEVLMSDYVKDINYIPVETRDSALIGEAKMFVLDGEILFWNPRGETVYVFSDSGKYLKNVGVAGRARGEFLGVANILQDEEGNYIFTSVKITVYSKEDGSCIEEIARGDVKGTGLDRFTSPIYNGNGHFSALHQADGAEFDSLVQFNVNKELVGKTVLGKMKVIGNQSITLGNGRKVVMPPMLVPSCLYEYNGQLNYIPGSCDTLYTLKNDVLVPRIAFEYGSLKEREVSKSSGGSFGVISQSFRGETEKMWLLDLSYPSIKKSGPNSFSTSSDKVPFVYDKINHKASKLPYYEEFGKYGFKNDIDGGMPFWPVVIKGDKMYQYIDAGTFIEAAAKSNSAKMKEVAAILNEESNPVIVVATLK